MFCCFLLNYTALETSFKDQTNLFFHPRMWHFLFFSLSLSQPLVPSLSCWDSSLVYSPGMNPSKQSLENSELNLGEGHREQPFPFSAPQWANIWWRSTLNMFGWPELLGLSCHSKEEVALKEVQAKLAKVRTCLRKEREAASNSYH